MSYLALDDRFPDNPKIIGLSDRAFRLHVVALCYCAAHLTDGFVPVSAKLWGELGSNRRQTCPLVSAGLWAEVEGGYMIHDYLEWNASAAQIKDKRRRDRERKRNASYQGSARNPNGTPKEFRADSSGSAPREISKEISLSRAPASAQARRAREQGKPSDYERALNMTRNGGHAYDDLAYHDELDRLELTPQERTNLEQLRDELNEPTPDPEDELF